MMVIKRLTWIVEENGVLVAKTPLKFNYRIVFMENDKYLCCGTNDPDISFKTIEQAKDYWQDVFSITMIKALYE